MANRDHAKTYLSWRRMRTRCRTTYAEMLEASTYICPQCSGSGEGQHDGTLCSACKGRGELNLSGPTREDYEAERADALNDERLLARGD